MTNAGHTYANVYRDIKGSRRSRAKRVSPPYISLHPYPSVFVSIFPAVFCALLRPLSLDLLTRCVQYLTVLFLVQHTPVRPYNSKITTNAGDKTVVIFSLFFAVFKCNRGSHPIPTHPRPELMHYRHTFYRIFVRTLLF